MNRCAGVLLHISSLPGKFGIGTLGEGAYKFVDFLEQCGFGAWQILPIGPCDSFNSPYAGGSSFAGNIFFIDPYILFKKGLLTEEEASSCISEDRYTSKYDFLRSTRENIFYRAFLRLSEKELQQVRLFEKKNIWVKDYALYCAIKRENGGKPWYEWGELKYKDSPSAANAAESLKHQILFYEFLQYEFYSQWRTLKEYANKKGIGIIGDMPIYPALDSADVWAEPDCFSLNGDLIPEEGAGVPPDYFCEDGQNWGNPLYNWEKMEKNGYSYWTDKLLNALSLFDSVRIDHFRAFEKYWAVPAGKSAKDGAWKKGPGMKLFRKLKEKTPGAEIIAEDLGLIDDDVRCLLRESGFPGMGVMQFAFIDGDDNPHLPHNYSKKTVAYTGTHDNNTILGWLWESDAAARAYALDYCGFQGDWGEGGAESYVIRSVIRTLLRSSALCAIVPMQDLCGFGADTRMNRPGTPEGNWEFRLTEEAMASVDTFFYKELNSLYKRGKML